MRSSNPILSRPDAFAPAGPFRAEQPRQTSPMTLDDVVTKTAITFGVLIVAAAAVFLLVPPALIGPITIVSSLVGVVTSFIVAFRRAVSPAVVLIFAAIEGLFVGGMSAMFERLYDGIVPSAVLATFAAAGVTLFAYKAFHIQLGARFQRIVSLATIAFAITMLINFGLSLAGINLGLRQIGGGVNLLSVVVSVIAVALAVANLLMDFDHIQRGIAQGADSSQSWKAAYGLTVTLVWLYVEILRVLSYLRRD